jgi:type I restriction enzyme S subunit
MDRATFFKHFDLLADQADAVAKMRGVVLELAIQGKVVAQNSKDEPASKLLERVCAHSAATDNARAKKSRDEIESLVPTEFWHLVPASWVVAPLGTVTNIIRGITFPSSAKGKIREKGTVACLRTANVQDVIEWDDLLFIPENYVGRDDQWLKPNDLVISMANSAALVGKVAQAREVPEKASFGGFLAVIRPIELD